MRKTFLILNLLGLLAVYGFACGTLDTVASSPPGTAGLELLLRPVQRATPWGLAGALGGLTLVLASTALVPVPPDGREKRLLRLTWSSALSAAFVAATAGVLSVAAIVVFSPQLEPGSVGTLFAAGVLEAGVATLLAAGLFFSKTRFQAFYPALCLLIIGMGTLGAMIWLGSCH
jgi:hypothetical protein